MNAILIITVTFTIASLCAQTTVWLRCLSTLRKNHVHFSSHSNRSRIVILITTLQSNRSQIEVESKSNRNCNSRSSGICSSSLFSLYFCLYVFMQIRKNAYKSMRTGQGPKLKVRISELSKVIHGQKSVEELTGILFFFKIILSYSVAVVIINIPFGLTHNYQFLCLFVICHVLYLTAKCN